MKRKNHNIEMHVVGKFNKKNFCPHIRTGIEKQCADKFLANPKDSVVCVTGCYECATFIANEFFRLTEHTMEIYQSTEKIKNKHELYRLVQTFTVPTVIVTFN